MITYQSTLLKKIPCNADTYHFYFSPPDDVNWTFKAGQYMIIHVPQDSTHTARRLYSIASAPSNKEAVEFIIQLVPGGIAGTYLATVKEGDKVTLQGPAGLFGLKESAPTKVLIATGTGIAPIRSLVTDALETGHPETNYHLFWGLKNIEETYILEELKSLATKYPNFHFKICLSRETDISSKITATDTDHFLVGRVTAAIDEFLQQQTPDDTAFYLCGGKDVIDSLKNYIITEKGIPADRVHFEKYT